MEPTGPIPDLRKCPRYPIDARAKVSFSKDGFAQRVNVKVNDIGMNGVAVISPVALPLGGNVEVEVVLPGTRLPLRLVAAIRNQKGQRYGIEFLSTTDAQKDEITKFGNGRKPASVVVGPGLGAAQAAN